MGLSLMKLWFAIVYRLRQLVCRIRGHVAVHHFLRMGAQVPWAMCGRCGHEYPIGTYTATPVTAGSLYMSGPVRGMVTDHEIWPSSCSCGRKDFHSHQGTQIQGQPLDFGMEIVSPQPETLDVDASFSGVPGREE